MARLPRPLKVSQEELKRFSHSGAPLERFLELVSTELQESLGADALALMHTDPVTFLGTGAFVRGFDQKAVDHFFAHVYLAHETSSFLDMRARGETVSLLSAYTQGVLERESRYREFYRPIGLKYEVRTCLRTGDAYWGALCILRGDDARDFTAGEQAFLAQIAPHLGEGIRTAIALQALGSGEADSTISLWVDRQNRILMASRGAAEMLDALRPGASAGQNEPADLPPPLQAVVALLQAGPRPPILEPRLTLQDRAGRWWTATALEPMAGSPLEVAAILVITPAAPGERFARLTSAFDLTPRERQLTELVAAGLSTGEIAGQLYVTPNTVQDHMKKIFAKCGVSSRRELMALLFHRQSAGSPFPGWR